MEKSGVFGVGEVESVSVTEGESVTLNLDITKTQEGELIWRFEQILIATFNIQNNESECHDNTAGGRFRDRLELDQNGSLIITNTTTQHTGLYGVYNRSDININIFSLTVYARLPVPVIISDSVKSSSSSSEQSCSLVCSVVNVSDVTFSWYKGNYLFSSIKMSDFNISLSLRLEIECLDDSYSCVINNPIRNQTQHLNSTELCQPCPETLHCCGFTEAVIRLVLSALVGVAAVAFLFYDITSRRLQQKKSLQTSQSHTD
ncbi:SLAM family member 5 [Labeo rohita]|uniref:SLAM family member 5 n=1 Tax=Labeo rohita TaxID=84645 RepID=A0ABQ8L8A8_LABRO|nr:SLAM family member 5 [Labeo rohita]